MNDVCRSGVSDYSSKTPVVSVWHFSNYIENTYDVAQKQRMVSLRAESKTHQNACALVEGSFVKLFLVAIDETWVFILSRFRSV